MAPKRKNDADLRCACRNTNCLKRYCVCFAADVVCTQACSCKECFNELRHEDKVDTAREEALLRNRSAFSTEKGDQDKQQKSGCRCKVRKCLSDGCKCYKANVECSGQCLCVGCENVHVKRGNTDKTRIETTTKASDNDDMDEIEFVNQFIQSPDETSDIESPDETCGMMIGTSSRDSDRKK